MGVTPYVFDYAVWTGLFPEMAAVSPAAAAGYFSMATLYVRNAWKGQIRPAVLASCPPNQLTPRAGRHPERFERVFAQVARVILPAPGSNPAVPGDQTQRFS